MTPGLWLFAGAGSGGHWVPGGTVAAALVRAGGGSIFLAGPRPTEKLCLARAPGRVVPFRGLPARGGGRHRLLFLGRLPALTWRCMAQLRRTGALGVVGLGGYGAVPAGLAARALGRPLVLLEQNVLPGRATRLLAPLAWAVCCAFRETAARLPRGCWTGNPVPPPETIPRALAARRFGLAPDRLTVLVVGGSQGAVGLNRAVLAAAPALVRRRREVQILHAAGPAAREVAAGYARLGLRARVLPFVEDMPRAYALADLVVSRAGGTTLAELAAWGLGAVLVPCPHHADGHQRANARAFARAGAALVVEEAEGGGRLGRLLAALVDVPERRERLGRAARRLARPGATAAVVAVLAAAAGRRGEEREPSWSGAST